MGVLGLRGTLGPGSSTGMHEAGCPPCISFCQPSFPTQTPPSTLHGFRLWGPQEALTCRVFYHMTLTAKGRREHVRKGVTM